MTTETLRITLVQTDIVWEDCEANLALLERLLPQISDPTDIIILPEMFNTGFSTQPAPIAVTMNAEGVAWMRQQARCKQADLVGSVIIQEDGRFYNRLLWAKADGGLLYYDKKYLFSMAGEDKTFAAGARHLTVQKAGWRLRPFICYDLRFPEWSRNFHLAYDVAIYTANWPAKRIAHWKALLVARAIENQAYVIGVNRVGSDGNHIEYSGDSMVVDPLGNIGYQAGRDTSWHTVELSMKALKTYRTDFPAWSDAVR